MHIDALQIGMLVVYVPPHAKGDKQHKDSKVGIVQYKSMIEGSDIVYVLLSGDCVSVGCHADDLK